MRHDGAYTCPSSHLNPYQEQYDSAYRQLAALQAREQEILQELKVIQQQAAQLQALILALEPMLAQQQAHHLENMGLADLCRAALEAYQGEWVTVQMVRSYIEQLGYRLEYNNIMAVLHNTLSRVGQKARNGLTTVYAQKIL